MQDLTQLIDQLNDWNAQNRFGEVLAEVNTVLDRHSVSDNDDLSALYVLRGNALYGLGRFEEATQSYAKAIELDTFNVQARCNYGSTLLTLGRYVDALNACDAAILTDENFAPSYVNAAHCLSALNHDDEAVYALRQAFTLEPDNAELGLTVANMAAGLNDFGVALDTYMAVAGLPDSPLDIHQTIYQFLEQAKSDPDLPRADWQKGLDAWRAKFISTPEVLRLYGELIRA